MDRQDRNRTTGTDRGRYASNYRQDFEDDYQQGRGTDDMRRREREDDRSSTGMLSAIGKRPWLAAGVALGAAYLTNRMVKSATQATGQEHRMGTRHSTFIAWLNDAHATEKALARILEKQAKETRDHPEMKAKIEEHLRATQRHAELVKGCIERQGGHVSAIKSGLGAVMGAVQGMSTSPAMDTLVKNAIADFAAENFEIASYKGLITAAEELGDSDTAQVCRQILADEEDMARWLDAHLPDTIRDCLRRQPERHEQAAGGGLPRTAGADHRFFEEHYQTHYADTGTGFRDYEGAYVYGARLAAEPSYRDRAWHDIEPEIERRWEREHAEPWASRREAVHYGYNRGTMHQKEGPDIEM